MRLRDVMSSDLPAMAPDDALRDAARRMTDRSVKALPVCDPDGLLLGVVTDWDVTRAAAEHDDLRSVSVGDAMSPRAIAAAPDVTLDDASDLMGEHQIHHLCVCEDGRYVGMAHLDVDWAHHGDLVRSPMATFSPAL